MPAAAAASLSALLQDAARRLEAGLGLEVRTAKLEARVLAGLALGCDTAWLIAHEPEPLFSDAAIAFAALLARRLTGEPVAYLRGEQEFFGRAFLVNPAVLIPRPETELLVETALAALPAGAAARVLDLGTGSGALALTLASERPGWEIYASDASPVALATAQLNARRLGVRHVRFWAGDWWQSVADVKFFDMVLSNPPYVAEDDPHLAALAYEPRGALVAPDAGRAALAAIIAGASPRLAPGGWLWLEHGWKQGGWCRERLAEAGLKNVATRRDSAGLERVTGGQKCRNSLQFGAVLPGVAQRQGRPERVCVES